MQTNNKLREALSEIVSNAKFAEKELEGEFGSMTNPWSYVTSMADIARSALSTPPRNCDRPECATSKAAQEVWRKEDGGKTAYYEWLLAPATKKKGGAK